MSISIRFLNEDNRGPEVAIGQISLGAFVEEFEMILTTWSRERYEHQWREGIQRILSGASKSCLISSFWREGKGFGGEWWPMYRAEEQIAVHNQLIRPDIFEQGLENFDPDNPYPSVPDRYRQTEDGKKPSEWLVPFDQIRPLSSSKNNLLT